MKDCPNCGIKYVVKRKGYFRKFCSSRCGAKFRLKDKTKHPKWIKDRKKCLICFNELSNFSRKFCSVRCFAKSIKGRKMPWIGPKEIEKSRLANLGVRKSIKTEFKNDYKVPLEVIEKRVATFKKNIANNKNWKGGVSTVPGRYRMLRCKAEGFHNREQWEKLKSEFNYSCACCLKKEPEIKLTRDHIKPIVLGGTNWISNIQPLCRSCNSRKNAKEIKYEFTI